MTVRAYLRLLSALASLTPPATAACQSQLVTPRVERLADGVYAVIRRETGGQPADANSLVIINERDVVVVDANITPSSSRAVIAEIKKLTRLPVRYVINTHYHSDHVYGNMAYQDAYPGVEFIAHAATRTDYLVSDPPALKNNLETVYPQSIARYKTAITRGTKRDGTPYRPEEIQRLRDEVAGLEWFVAEMKGFRHVPPSLTLTDSMTLVRGARLIAIKHLGRGNTAGDVVVYLPNERIIATGDAVVSPIPYPWESFPRDWLASLRRLRGHDAAIVMPGHGDVQRDWSYVDGVIGLFDTAIREVSALGPQIKPDSAIKLVTLRTMRDRFAGSDPAMQASFDAFAAAFVERVLQDVRGELQVRP